MPNRLLVKIFLSKISFRPFKRENKTKMCNKNSFAKMLSISGVQFTGLAVILVLCEYIKWHITSEGSFFTLLLASYGLYLEPSTQNYIPIISIVYAGVGFISSIFCLVGVLCYKKSCVSTFRTFGQKLTF